MFLLVGIFGYVLFSQKMDEKTGWLYCNPLPHQTHMVKTLFYPVKNKRGAFHMGLISKRFVLISEASFVLAFFWEVFLLQLHPIGIATITATESVEMNKAE